MIVAIDAGNTRTKWGVFDAAGQLVLQGDVGNGQLDALTAVAETWRGCRRIVVSNVAGAAVAAQLEALCEWLQLPMVEIAATSSNCGVTNGYIQPGQLGSDRWAGLVAAWHRYRKPCVLATAGTALTVDALSSQGEFLGGLIVPGWRMMQDSLTSGAAGLASMEGHLQDFPVNTGDAIYSGIWQSMAGAVEHTCRVLQLREGRAPLCVLSGGDAHLLQAALSSPTEIADNLVLYGLCLIEREYA